jgi:photosystem II stability/assembly factor-like uncharacterized protein
MFKKILLLIVLILTATVFSGCFEVKRALILASGGVFKSTDGGVNWDRKAVLSSLPNENQFLENSNVNVLVFDPQDSKTLYLGTREKGLFVSIDAAESWQEIKNLPKNKINAVAVDPQASYVVYVAIENQIYKTTDANRNWKSVYLEGLSKVEISSLAVNFINSDIIYAGLSDGRIIRSLNKGVSWSLVGNFKGEVGQILLSSKNSNIIYAVIRKAEIYFSSDQGENWQIMDSGRETSLSEESIKNLSIYLTDPNGLLMTKESGFLETNNNGQTWSEYKLLTSQKEAQIGAVAIDPQNHNIIYYAIPKTLYKSTDQGENWTTYLLPSGQEPRVILIDPVKNNVIYLGAIKNLN